MTQASLFDTPAKADCPMCHGAGEWRRYHPGRHPDTYPTIRCHCTTPKDHQ